MSVSTFTRTHSGPTTAPETNTDPLLDVPAAAAYLGCSTRWVRRAIFEKRLEVVKLGGLVRVRRSTLDALIAASTRPAVPGPK